MMVLGREETRRKGEVKEERVVERDAVNTTIAIITTITPMIIIMIIVIIIIIIIHS